MNGRSKHEISDKRHNFCSLDGVRSIVRLFISNDKMILCDSLLPFGAGRRVCAGEMLAKNRSFLFAASLVQRFDFRSPPGTPLPSCDPRTFVYEAAYHPLPFNIVAQPRSQLQQENLLR
jgi:hypothetical protein